MGNLYKLIVLTHGESATLPEAIDALLKFVTPTPMVAYIHCDGPVGMGVAPAAASLLDHCPVIIGGGHDQRGFCEATAACWKEAKRCEEEEFVFWLEHDFVFRRPLDLAGPAEALRIRPQLAQMVFLRNAVSLEEVAAGGLMQRFPDWRDTFQLEQPTGLPHLAWLEHNVFFSTNPSLIPASLFQRFEWPVRTACEGHFGIQLREQSYRFAFWGNRTDPIYVEHVGRRTGFGY